ncbi:MAG: D-glycero-beta-D-manno-heptose 1-phosphate adenylyltransferase [Candidatus Alcyoniella australis]|nr:D-glycero-beta-D-manno-heptose 1-phosphate adenylyltransferase [Candidatus Alcyoniella australis]
MGSILKANRLARILERRRAQGQCVVFTNGCFDLMHLGHARYLTQARAQGDLLVVGINTDASVARLKGPDRPLIPQERRAELLSGLEHVDYVTFFDEPDPLQIIELLQPDVLVKGADWPPDKIIGRQAVEARGGRVFIAELTQGYSSTNMLKRIQRLEK